VAVLKVRSYRTSDEAGVLEVLRFGLKDQARFAEPANAPDDPGFFRPAWAEQSESLRLEPENWWIAAEDARLVGAMRLAFWLEADGAPAASVVELDVHPDVRNQGIGGRLLAQAESVARSRGDALLFIGGFAANPAMRLYRRAGFAESPECLPHIEGPDHLVLCKRLRPNASLDRS